MSSTPRITLSSASSRLVSVPSLMEIAAMSGLRGLDLDLVERNGRESISQLVATSTHLGTPITSLWLAPQHDKKGGGSLDSTWTEMVLRLIDCLGVDDVVFDLTGSRQIMPTQDDLASLTGWQRLVRPRAHLSAVIRTRHLNGSREQLDALIRLRRLAEEWGVSLVLDAVGAIDRHWEVEAAVTHLLPRLRIVRLGPLTLKTSERVQQRMTKRLVKSLIESQFEGSLSLCTGASKWHGLWRPGLTRALDETCTVIARRQQELRPPWPEVRQSRPRIPRIS